MLKNKFCFLLHRAAIVVMLVIHFRYIKACPIISIISHHTEIFWQQVENNKMSIWFIHITSFLNAI